MKATQLDHKMKYLGKNKVNIESLRNYKEFMRTNKSILKSQQWLKSEKHNDFTEEINNIAFN